MALAADVRVQFAQEGFALVPSVLDDGECLAIADVLSPAREGGAGTRCLLAQRWCAALAGRIREHGALAGLIPAQSMAVQCTYFEKAVDRNWLVPVHQDLSIPVAERVTDPALQGWAEKEGELFVQPPVQVLEQLVAVRLHLDSCTEQDGPLRVVPGSHKFGRIAPEAAVALRKGSTETVCRAERGAALVMRPLLLHASSKATGSSRRRVLHFVFGPRQLPCGLSWPQ